MKIALLRKLTIVLIFLFPCTNRRSFLSRHFSKDQSLAITQLSYSVPDIIIAPKSLGADDFESQYSKSFHRIKG